MAKFADVIEDEKPTKIKTKTFTKTQGVYPQRIKTEKDSLHSRIIIVSPYSQLNVFLETEIPKIIRGGLVDIISEAEMRNHPFIDVNKREEKLQKPYWVIDFGKIIAPAPSYRDLLESRIDIFNDLIRDVINHSPVLKKQLLQFPVDIDNSIIFLNQLKISLDESSYNRLYKEWLDEDTLIEYDDSVKRDVQFDGYRKWASKNKLTLITPKPLFAQTLEERSFYDEEGNLKSYRISISDYTSQISEDLELLYRQERSNLKLFNVKFGQEFYGVL